MKHCGHADHVNPYWDCEHCQENPGGPLVIFKGTGWTPKTLTHDRLPPHDEVQQKRREQGRVTLRSSEQDR